MTRKDKHPNLTVIDNILNRVQVICPLNDYHLHGLPTNFDSPWALSTIFLCQPILIEKKKFKQKLNKEHGSFKKKNL